MCLNSSETDSKLHRIFTKIYSDGNINMSAFKAEFKLIFKLKYVEMLPRFT